MMSDCPVLFCSVTQTLTFLATALQIARSRVDQRPWHFKCQALRSFTLSIYPNLMPHCCSSEGFPLCRAHWLPMELMGS